MLAAMAVVAVAAPGGGGGGGALRLEIKPGGGPQTTGQAHTVEVQVTKANGDGADGVGVDLEITGGPGDDDMGTAGNTPASPDMSCVTAGGGNNQPATCTVSYAELDDQAGSDGVLAWIDDDGVDATVEADMGEGENQHTAGAEGCAPGTKGGGSGPEPDGTDCAERRWMARAAAVVDLETETGSGPAGGATTLQASVFDQAGRPVKAGTPVAVELLTGSASDPGDGDDFGNPDAGTCTTGGDGRCSLTFTTERDGQDRFCGYLAGREGACSEQQEAPERDNGADVVLRTWSAPAPPPPPPPPVPPDDPGAGGGGGGTVDPPPGEEPEPADPQPDPVTSDPEPKPKPGDTGEDRPPVRDDEPAGRDDDRGDQGAAAPPGGGQSGGGGGGGEPAPVGDAATSSAGDETRDGRPSVAAARGHAGPAGTRLGPDGAPRGIAPHGVARAPRARSEGREPSPAPGRNRGERLEQRIAQLSSAAVKTADSYSFPLSLTLLVLAFLAIQGRIDRRDPKLRLAPVDSKHDLVSFS